MRLRDQVWCFLCMWALAVAILVLTLSYRAKAAIEPPDCPLAVAEQVVVSTVVDGGSFKLADGRRVRLAAILAPMLSLGRSNVADQPLAEEAKARLTAILRNRTVGLSFDERGTDRHGDVLAYVVLDGPSDLLQARLVRDGFARVRTQSETRKCAGVLLAFESEARSARRGIWAHPFYRPRWPDELDGDIATFQIVEGTVVYALARRDRVFLNFGTDYRHDFTITISARDVRRMAKAAIDPLTWKAKRIRVRGWLSLLNGPEIELTHSEQIEILK